MEAASERESGSSVGWLALASGEEESDVVDLAVLWCTGGGANATTTVDRRAVDSTRAVSIVFMVILLL